MNTALLIIDAQVNMFEPDPVYRAPEILATLRDLIARARAAGAPVIFVRHNGGQGSSSEPDTPSWAIHPDLKPLAAEAVIDKTTPDSFYQTSLPGVLAAEGIQRLVIAGMLTDYCVDTTVRQAKSLDYAVTLAADGHSTRSGVLPADQIVAHHNNVLRAFADVRAAADITFDNPPLPHVDLDALTTADRAGIQAGLSEWLIYEQWLAAGEGHPFWPHTHPNRVADALKGLWDPAFTPRARYLDPPRWEVGLARAFWRPLENIPPAFRKATRSSCTWRPSRATTIF